MLPPISTTPQQALDLKARGLAIAMLDAGIDYLNKRQELGEDQGSIDEQLKTALKALGHIAHKLFSASTKNMSTMRELHMTLNRVIEDLIDGHPVSETRTPRGPLQPDHH